MRYLSTAFSHEFHLTPVKRPTVNISFLNIQMETGHRGPGPGNIFLSSTLRKRPNLRNMADPHGA